LTAGKGVSIRPTNWSLIVRSLRYQRSSAAVPLAVAYRHFRRRDVTGEYRPALGVLSVSCVTVIATTTG
jgi:hypothetical protein